MWASATAACCGTTPLPIARNCWVRVKPSSGSVTHPAGKPIIHSLNAGFSCGLPVLEGCVGEGASRPSMVSQRRMAGSYSRKL